MREGDREINQQWGSTQRSFKRTKRDEENASDERKGSGGGKKWRRESIKRKKKRSRSCETPQRKLTKGLSNQEVANED